MDTNYTQMNDLTVNTNNSPSSSDLEQDFHECEEVSYENNRQNLKFRKRKRNILNLQNISHVLSIITFLMVMVFILIGISIYAKNKQNINKSFNLVSSIDKDQIQYVTDQGEYFFRHTNQTETIDLISKSYQFMSDIDLKKIEKIRDKVFNIVENVNQTEVKSIIDRLEYIVDNIGDMGEIDKTVKSIENLVYKICVIFRCNP